MSLFSSRTSSRTNGAVRPPAVAGTFYPAQPARLRADVDRYLKQAVLPPLSGTVRAVIAPHAGYIYSGPIAGHSFRALGLQIGAEDVIFLLGPAHYVPVFGVAVGRYRAFETPLGQIAVDEATEERLVEISPDFVIRNDAHQPEHSLEVELPFLQALDSNDLRIVPLLFGRTDPQRVAEALLPFIRENPSAKIVVSSDLSHFYPYEAARRLDTAFLDAVIARDLRAVARGEACGRDPILTLMTIADHLGWEPHLLDYRNSGDTAGDRQRVVGYGAVAYTEA